MSAADRAKVLLLATCDTKSEVAGYLLGRLRDLQLDAELIDISLTLDRSLSGENKLQAMQKAADKAAEQINEHAAQAPIAAIAAIGGATGVQVFAETCAKLQLDVAKVVITTATADLRKSFAGEQVISVISPADLFGINSLLRDVMDNAAAVIAALGTSGGKARPATGVAMVAVSALGITQGVAEAAYAALSEAGAETTVFHASYYGGRAMCRWLVDGTCAGLLDATTHELTSLLLDPDGPVPADRFCVRPDLPRVVLPGAVNVRTAGPLAGLNLEDLAGKHYRHSEEFTHVALSDEQLEKAAIYLAGQIEQVTAEQLVILPMGGFSSEDKPGGAVENTKGRAVFAETLQTALAGKVEVAVRSEHINDPAIGTFAAQRIMAMLPDAITARNQ